MTNGDKIRQMSDEELVPHITCPNDECLNLDDQCNYCILKWLKEEVQKDE